jgi:hypothetical protein
MVHKKCGNYGTVAEQRASYLFGKSPKLCGWKIYVICHTSYFASLVLALLLNTSRSFTLLRIIWPGLYNTHLMFGGRFGVSQKGADNGWRQPIRIKDSIHAVCRRVMRLDVFV